MNIWTYWEGELYPHINLCLETMRRACDVSGVDFYLVTPENIGEYVPEGVLHNNYKRLKQPALQADCIRAALLATHGGWWWDADTISLQSPSALHYEYGDVESFYMIWSSPPTRVLNGYIYLCAESPIARSWLEAVNSNLSSNPSGVSWCSLGEQIITNLLTCSKTCQRVDRRLFLPIDIDSDVKRFFTEKTVEEYIESDTICFGLNHSWFVYHHLEDLHPSRWNDSLLIHKLLRFAGKRVA